MSSINENELPTIKSVYERIICQQADMLARMSKMGNLVQEQQEEDQRAREEDAVHIM